MKAALLALFASLILAAISGLLMLRSGQLGAGAREAERASIEIARSLPWLEKMDGVARPVTDDGAGGTLTASPSVPPGAAASESVAPKSAPPDSDGVDDTASSWAKLSEREKVRVRENYRRWETLAQSRRTELEKRYRWFKSLAPEKRRQWIQSLGPDAGL